MTPPNIAPSPNRCEARVAYVPHERTHLYQPPLPTAKSWRFLRDHCNVKGVRLQYLYDDPRWWPGAMSAVLDGGLEVHGNFCVADFTKPSPADVEQSAFKWTVVNDGGTFGRMASVSFGNEPGYAFPDDDISKGGSVDHMKLYVDNFWLPFIRGVRRANPDIIIGGPDAESADTLQRFVDLVDVDQWLVHPYGEKEIANDGELDYATMAGTNGSLGADSKLGFTEVRPTNPLKRKKQLIISEIDHQQHKAARARGELRGIATDAEIDLLAAFSVRMRDEFHAPVITFGTAEYLCTRVPVVLDWPPPDPPRDPPYTWSTWTHGGAPELSEAGKRLAAVFAPVKPALHGRPIGRRG